MDAFRKDLEKCCYVKRFVADQTILKKLKQEYKAIIFAIDNLDLRIEREHTEAKITDYETKYNNTELVRKEHNEHTQKDPTRLWKQFWSIGNQDQQYPIRLNPEIKIFWREARESRVKKYGKKSSNYDPNKKNRFLTPQYTLSTTITLNATVKAFAVAWDNTSDIQEKIEKFNEHYNKSMQNDSERNYFYGIDRGLKELATLCIVAKNDEGELKDFPAITTYTLKNDKYYYKDETKDLSKTDKYDKGFGGPIENVSLVINKIDDPNWFEKKMDQENACLDLTTAKLIKGKIITNGDLQSFLTLKIIAAKRKIFDLYNTREIKPNYNIDGKKTFAFYENGKSVSNSDFTIYWLTDEQKSSFEKKGQPILDDLRQYLDDLRQSETFAIPPIEKINHLRDAITANMVGILNYLDEQFPAQKIALENLDEYKGDIKFIESHRMQSDQHISRRLEWALYRKFQQKCLVPPHIKQTILLKDEYKTTQFGIIQFIKTKGTSSNCPVCSKEHKKTKDQDHYICQDTEKCGFSSKESNKRQGLIPLTNSDKVAAYNVAKDVRN